MGIGNYYPRDWRDIHYRMICIPIGEGLGYDYDNPEYAQDEAAFHSLVWENLIEDIRALLRKSALTGRSENVWDDGCRVLYRTPLLEVTLTDNQANFAVVVRPRSDFDGDREANLAPLHIDRVAKKLFKGLQGIYGELTVPSGGYMASVWDGDINKT